jgi:hypothetical protein
MAVALPTGYAQAPHRLNPRLASHFRTQLAHLE